MINRVTFEGHLQADAELRTTATGKYLCEFILAVPKRIVQARADAQTHDFFPCKAWGQLAEHLGTHGIRGAFVSVDGRLESRRFLDKRGVQQMVIEIVCENAYMPATAMVELASA